MSGCSHCSTRLLPALSHGPDEVSMTKYPVLSDGAAFD
jgi:hypothetical protein